MYLTIFTLIVAVLALAIAVGTALKVDDHVQREECDRLSQEQVESLRRKMGVAE